VLAGIATFGRFGTEFVFGDFTVAVFIEGGEGVGCGGDFVRGEDAVAVLVECGEERWDGWGAAFGTVGVFLGAGVGGECDGECDPVWFHGVVVWWFGGLNAVPVSWDALMKPWDCERRVWEAAENC
jgi:hypothetical protein